MSFSSIFTSLLAFLLLVALSTASHGHGHLHARQVSATPPLTSTPVILSTGASRTAPLNSSATTTSAAATSSPPDVWLNVPTLSVGRIELVVEDLSADINLNANVASLVSINAGVQISVTKINVTITDVDAQLELIVRLGHLVDIVNRVFQSLDLNPLLISTVNDVTGLLQPIVGEVDSLLGSITQGGNTLSFIVDNLGNIVQEVTDAAGNVVSTIVGNYQTNMTYTGISQSLGSGLTEKTYSYSPLNALVDIVFNTAGQVVQATVVGQNGTSTSSSSVAAATSSSTTS